MKKNSYLEYEIKSKKTYKKETKEVLLTINYTDRKVNFTKLLQCRNLYLFNFERARLSRIFWDTELILKYRTWPVFVVERLIGLFKWVSRLWPNGTLANLLRTRVPEVYIPFTDFGTFLSISFFLFINHDDWKEFNCKKIKPLIYFTINNNVTNNKKF